MENIKRKEQQAIEMSAAMIGHMREFCEKQVLQLTRDRADYNRAVFKNYVALKMGRRFIGSELKRSYYNLAIKNLESANRDPLWDMCKFKSLDKTESQDHYVQEYKDPKQVEMFS